MRAWLHEMSAGLRGLGVEALAVLASIVLATLAGVVALAIV